MKAIYLFLCCVCWKEVCKCENVIKVRVVEMI